MLAFSVCSLVLDMTYMPYNDHLLHYVAVFADALLSILLVCGLIFYNPVVPLWVWQVGQP